MHISVFLPSVVFSTATVTTCNPHSLKHIKRSCLTIRNAAKPQSSIWKRFRVWQKPQWAKDVGGEDGLRIRQQLERPQSRNNIVGLVLQPLDDAHGNPAGVVHSILHRHVGLEDAEHKCNPRSIRIGRTTHGGCVVTPSPIVAAARMQIKDAGSAEKPGLPKDANLVKNNR